MQHFHRCLHACFDEHSNTYTFSSFYTRRNELNSYTNGGTILILHHNSVTKAIEQHDHNYRTLSLWIIYKVVQKATEDTFVCRECSISETPLFCNVMYINVTSTTTTITTRYTSTLYNISRTKSHKNRLSICATYISIANFNNQLLWSARELHETRPAMTDQFHQHKTFYTLCQVSAMSRTPSCWTIATLFYFYFFVFCRGPTWLVWTISRTSTSRWLCSELLTIQTSSEQSCCWASKRLGQRGRPTS